MKRFIDDLEKANSYNDEEFVLLINQGMELLGLSVHDMARRFGTSTSSITRWTNGITSPHPAMRVHVFDWLRERATKTLPKPETPWTDLQLDSLRRCNETDIVGVGEDDQRRDRKWIATVDAALDDARKSLEAFSDGITSLTREHSRAEKYKTALEALRTAVIAYIDQHGLDHDWLSEEEGSDACPEDDTCRCSLIQAIEKALKPVVE